jgi:hypothetical protein
MMFTREGGFPSRRKLRALVLILASDTEPVYLEHQRLWRTYMHSNPSVDCYFYKGDPTLESEAELKGDTLFLRIEDTFETVHEKTLRAFAFFRPRLWMYTCVFRTNLSSVVILDRYVEYCKTIPRERFCSAVVGWDGVRHPSGCGYTITPDLICRLVNERPPLRVQDDVSLGDALASWGIPITPAPRVDLLNPECIDAWRGRVPPDFFHFRVKQDRGETLPELDVIQSLISEYYGTPRDASGGPA